MRATVYKALGYLVWTGFKASLTRRQSNQIKVAGGSAGVLLVGLAIAGLILSRKGE